MGSAKIFKSGNSQAVRLPKQFPRQEQRVSDAVTNWCCGNNPWSCGKPWKFLIPCRKGWAWKPRRDNKPQARMGL